MKRKDDKSILNTIHRVFHGSRNIFLGISAIFFLSVGYLLWNLNAIEEENTQVKEVVYGLEKDNLNEQNSVFKMCIAVTEEKKDEYAKDSEDYDMAIQQKIKLLRERMPEQKENLERIQELLQGSFQDRQLAILNSSKDAESQKTLQILEEDYAPKMQEIAVICQEISQQVTKDGQQRMKQAMMVSAGSMAVLLAVTLFSVFLFGRREKKMQKLIREPIHEIMRAMQEMEEGNLGYTIAYQSENEMGILAESIRRTMGHLEGYIENISGTLGALAEKKYGIQIEYEYKGDFLHIAEALRKITEELRGTIAEISQGTDVVEETKNRVQTIADTLADDTMENAATIEELSMTAEELVGQVNANVERIQRVGQEEEGVTGQMDQCRENMQKLCRVMQQTQESSSSLEQFMQSMDEVYEQINLLSLNASIEAARAGEAGKGFGVVAAEIRNLSERTVELADKSRKSVGGCTRNIHSGMEIVNGTTREIDSASQKFHGILLLVREVEEISESQLVEMQNFENSIADMAKIVQKDSGMAEHLEEGVKDMNGAVEQICRKMDEFQVEAVNPAKSVSIREKVSNQS